MPVPASKSDRLPCRCPCGCEPRGCDRHVTARWCWACTQGIHHVRNFEPKK